MSADILHGQCFNWQEHPSTVTKIKCGDRMKEILASFNKKAGTRANVYWVPTMRLDTISNSNNINFIPKKPHEVVTIIISILMKQRGTKSMGNLYKIPQLARGRTNIQFHLPATQNVVCGTAAPTPPGACGKCRTAGPTPALWLRIWLHTKSPQRHLNLH